MRQTKHFLLMAAMLLGSLTASAATYSDWTSTNQGQSSSTSSNTYNITASAGDVLTFDWLVSSESNYDKLIVTLSGSEILNKSGEQSGTYQHTFTSSGSYTMVVKYTKDGSVNKGSDYAKVYDITLSTGNSGDSGSEDIIASGTCGDNLTWELTGKGDLIIGGTGAMTDNPWYQYKSSIKNVVIQEGVTSIVAAAFDGCINLVDVIIPNTITQIDYYAFYGCASLMSVILPNSVRYIGSSAFQDCTGLINVTIPNGSIASYMFYGCTNLANVTIGGGVTQIEWGIFKGCTSLKKLCIEDGTETLNITPQGIKFLEDAPLETLYLGRNITYTPSSTSAGSSPFSNLSTLKSVTIGSNVTSIESETFRNCSNLTSIICEAVTPPTCGSNTFYNVSKTISVNVPSTSVSAYKSASYWKDFTNIIGMILDSGVCGDNLTWTLFDDGELVIEGRGPITESTWDEYRMTITSLTLKEGITSIGAYAFGGCEKLTSITIPSSVTWIGETPFIQCSELTSIRVAEGNSVYDSRNNCNAIIHTATNTLKQGCAETIIPESVTAIGNSAFSFNSNLVSIAIPEEVTSIGNDAFVNCSSLASITIPENSKLTSIGNSAFSNCSSLTSITIPEGVASIGSMAISGCANLTFITCKAQIPPTFGHSDFPQFAEENKNIPVYVPKSSIAEYQKAAIWKDFTNIQPLVGYIASGTCGTNLTWKLTDEGELTIEGGGKMSGSPWWYDYATLIKKVIIEEGVTSIVSNAFYGCSNLSSIVIPECVTSVGAWAFEGCSKLVDVSVGSIEWWINYGANTILDYLVGHVNLYVGEELLTEVEIPSTITSIPSGAFRNCTNVVSVSIPESITAISQGAFDDTGWYTNQPDGVLYIGDWLYGYKGEMPEDFELVVKDGTRGIVDYAFEDCANLIRVTIPESTLYIGNAAFMSSGLILATMSEGVNRIGGGAFWGCRSLTDVAIPESVTEVGNEAFAETAWCRKQPCGVLYLSGWAVGLKNCGDCENCEHMNYDAVYVLDGTKGLAEGFTNWSSVVIPESVVYLNKAFANMNGGGYIMCKSMVPPCNVDSKTFERVKNSSTLYVPANSLNAYSTDEYWGEFANIKVIDFTVWSLTAEGELIIDGLGTMDNYEPEYTPWHIFRSSINSVTIKEGITSVGDNAFALCEELASVSLPYSLVSVGEGAFAECDKLKSVVIPENVTTIGSGAFVSTGLSSITCNAVAPPVVADWATFHYVSKSIPVYVPLSSIPSYRNAEYWNEFTNIQATPEYITINQYGSATYCSEYALDFSEVEGLKAYAATGYDTETGVVTLSRVMTAKAGVGLFIKGEPGDYEVPVLESTSFNTLNMLVGTSEAVTLGRTSEDGLYVNYKYTLSGDNATPQFYVFDDGFTLGAGKAYLQIPTTWLPATDEAKSISLRFDDGEGTTDMENSQFTIDNSQLTYDLYGRRVDNPVKGGIYIVGGKKVVVK